MSRLSCLGVTASVAFAAAALLPGCGFEVVHGNGTVRSEERAVPAFTHAAIRAELVTAVVDGDEPGVVLEADENLLGHLVARVDDGVLVLEVDDPSVVLQPTAPMTAIVTTRTLVGVEAESAADVSLEGWSGDTLTLHASGSGDVAATKLAASVLQIEASGSGDVLVEGEVDTLHARVSGSGALVATDLDAGAVEVELSGSGKTTVHTAGSVSGTLSGSGDLVIHGGPSRVDVSDSGSGAVSIR